GRSRGEALHLRFEARRRASRRRDRRAGDARAAAGPAAHRRRARRRSRRAGRVASDVPRGARRAGAGAAGSVAHRGARFARRNGQPPAEARAVRRRRRHRRRAGRGRAPVGRGEFPGERPHPRAPRPAGRGAHRHLARPCLDRRRREPEPRDRRRVLDPSAAERERQLGQDRAARSGSAAPRRGARCATPARRPERDGSHRHRPPPDALRIRVLNAMARAMRATAPAGSTAHRGFITVSVMLATIMQALDTTIANVALPHMQGTMGATYEQIAWVLTSYIVAAAICMPLTGFVAARFGRRRLFLWSVVGFTITSMLCGAAQNLEQIVLFRLLQGVFGASLVPLSQAVLLDAYPREQHGSAMALWGLGVMVGPILGPTLGGWLTEYYDWRWVFYINLPFGILAWLGITAYVHETPLQHGRRFDWFGFAMLSLAIGAFQMMLDRGHTLDWFASTEIAVEAILAGAGLYLFVAHMLTHDHPFLEPQLFRDRNFVVGLLFIFVVGMILLTTMTLLPPFLQNLLGYPVVDVGVLLAPRGVGTMAADR